MSGWESFGPTVRRECPLCDWHMDEPPMEAAAQWSPGGDALIYRVRQHSAVPAGLAHILAAHPESEVAAEIRVAVAGARPEPTTSPRPCSGDPVGRLTAGVLDALDRSVEREVLRRARWAQAAASTPCALHGNLPPCTRCLALVTGT